jgi:hypothetical protein
MRRTVAVVIGLAMYWLCLWLFGFARFSWLPHAVADRWVVAAGFAAAGSGVVYAALSSWTERDGDEGGEPARARPEAAAPAWVRQKAKARRNARINQAGRDQHISGT